MFRRRLALLALVATVAVAAAPPGVPHEVSNAVVALPQACAAWPGSLAAAPLGGWMLCDMAIHPDQTEGSVLFTSFEDAVGAVLLLSMLVDVLISAWTRRFPFGAKS
jgi:hypothetical protein